ncbi:hypothetical protein PGB90_003504 [Kerria lacca]
MSLCFFTRHPHFPQIEDNSIDTLEFLNASQGLVWLIEQFGFGFEPVRDDLRRNIEKLLKKYNENTEEYRCLMRMILQESRKGEKNLTENLLWLRRGLSLMEKFMSIFLQKEQMGVFDENMSSILNEAYEKSLKTHHGIFTQILFNVLCSRCPNRTQFLKILGCAEINDKEQLLSMLNKYLTNLQSNLEVLMIFYQNNNIKPHH